MVPRNPERRAYRIQGVTRTALWKAWKDIRKDLTKLSVRDVVDYVDFDIHPEVWINQLLRRIDAGTYEPEPPERFTLAKSNGFSRTMTLPHIPDAVLYRAIADYLYSKLKPRECKNVYYARGIPQPEVHADVADSGTVPPIWHRVCETETPYEPTSKKKLRAWLLYNQYRKRLIFQKTHRFIVTTDITNFFDNILFSRVLDCFQEITVPPGMLGLLLFLLERLSIREPFGESPRIGIPVDEFGCSRTIAHLVLFPHDQRVVSRFGEDAYARWMDDQNVGVASFSDGLKALAFMGESLGRMHLTPNASKSRIVSLKEAAEHFHLEVNQALDEWESDFEKRADPSKTLRRRLKAIWRQAKGRAEKGNWEKVLKRFYSCAAKVNGSFLRSRALEDALNLPTIAQRVSEYMRSTLPAHKYYAWAQRVWRDKRQVYQDVQRVLVESLLRLEPTQSLGRALRLLASGLLNGTSELGREPSIVCIAPLLLLRYGDRRSLPLLRSCLKEKRGRLDGQTVGRAVAFVYASYGRAQADELRRIAGASLRNVVAYPVQLMNRIRAYESVPERFRQRVAAGFDPLQNRNFLDMRRLLLVRLLGLNDKPAVGAWLRDKKQSIILRSRGLSEFDRNLVERLWPSGKLDRGPTSP